MNTTILNATMAILFAAIGYSVCALLSIAKKSDVALSSAPTEKPTILWTVGNICKWGGEVHEIRFFRQDRDGQTLACIFTDGATTGICVPIEELEAVEE